LSVSEEIVGTVRKIVFSWTSAADGTASETTEKPYSGEILGLATVPDTGDDQPSDQYDITITDEDDLDVLAGQGANRSNASTEYVTARETLGCVANDTLTINVSGAGDTKSGTAYLFIR